MSDCTRAPRLRANVGELRAVSGVEIIGAAGEMRHGIRRDERVDNADLGVLLGDDQCVGENGRTGAGGNVSDEDWRGHLHATRDVDERAVPDECGVQRREFFGAELLRLGHEVGLQQSSVGDRRFSKGRHHDSRGQRSL